MGKYRRAAHRSFISNNKTENSSVVPILSIFFSKYDFHSIIKMLHGVSQKIKYFKPSPTTIENFISRGYGGLMFLDSSRFLDSSLGEVTSFYFIWREGKMLPK